MQLWTDCHCLSHLANSFIRKEGQLAGDMIAGGMILCVKLFLSRDRILEFGGSVYEFIIKELT